MQSRLACLWVLCATLFVAAQAAEGPKPSAVPYFAHWLVDAKSGKIAQAQTHGGLSVAEGKEEYSYQYSYYEDSKHVCLQEQNRRDCRYYGCQNWLESCSGGACENCRVGDFFTSDFTCCKEEHYYYGSSSKPNNLFLPKSSVGSCDWTIFWFRQDYIGTKSGPICGWVEVVPHVTYKVGTAFGTCYFNDESEYCGEPLCDRMVMSVQGNVYVTRTYSHQPTGSIDSCLDLSHVGDYCSGKRKRLSAFDGLFFGASKAPASSNATKHAAPEPAPAKGGLKVQYDAEHSETIYYGEALIISGTIDSINGQKHETKYDDGLFEYVPYYEGFPYTGGVDPNIPWVKGNSYKLEFWKDGSKYHSK